MADSKTEQAPRPKLRPEVAYRLRGRRGRGYVFESLQSRLAGNRTDQPPACGGSWGCTSGHGEAWREGDRVWHWRRPLRGGQWAGPWQRERIA